MITSSIVLYKTDKQQLNSLLSCIIESNSIDHIYLIDNSPTDILRVYSNYSPIIEYIYTAKNIGYGAGHNIAIKEAIKKDADYHIVLNPDIRFDKDVIKKINEF